MTSYQMISDVSQRGPQGALIRSLRAIAPIALVVGAAGSLGFLFHEGRRTPRFLLLLFVLWVLFPFATLIWATLVSKRWPVVTQAALYSVILAVTLGTLTIYAAVACGLFSARPAAIFLLVPPASLLLTGIVVSIAALTSRRRPH